mgnify:CR=1 FL=1|tara:strand:- start:863 stop:1276 length:414 start_codon:yes stop_codon:yes gene_type:complete
MTSDISILNFLEGSEPNINKLYIQDIWDLSDEEIENTHDFIQWLFPTDTPSRYNLAAPVLNEQDIINVKKSQKAQTNLKFSANWFLNFLDRYSYWIDRQDHNQLRIKRIKKCLGLLIDKNLSEKFLIQVNRLKERKE